MLIENAALWLGLGVGTAMLLSVCTVFIRHRTFGVGGSVMTPFGVVLMGLSIWSTARVSVTPDGGITAEFEALKRAVQEVQEEAQELSENVSAVQAEVLDVTSEVKQFEPVLKNVEELELMTRQLDQKLARIENMDLPTTPIVIPQNMSSDNLQALKQANPNAQITVQRLQDSVEVIE